MGAGLRAPKALLYSRAKSRTLSSTFVPTADAVGEESIRGASLHPSLGEGRATHLPHVIVVCARGCIRGQGSKPASFYAEATKDAAGGAGLPFGPARRLSAS